MEDTNLKGLRIEPEKPEDHAAIRRLTEEAFKNVPQASGDEANLVERLRRSPEYVPHLSLAARLGEELVGHIMFTRLYIDGAWQSLILAPLSVAPRYQRRGVGGLLIEEGHRLAAELGFVASVLVGHADYYPRFGYRPLSDFAFTIPFPAPPECSLVKELAAGALAQARGEAVFSAAFAG